MGAGTRICLFIPTYNVRKTIRSVLKGIPDRAAGRIETVLIVDNGSSDGTLDEIKNYLAESPDKRVRVLRNRENYLLGGSTIVALTWAIREGYDFLICMHSDGQADPGCLVDFVEKCRPGIDFIFGSRFLPSSDISEYSLLRAAVNRLFVTIQQMILRKKIFDIGAFIAFNLKTVSGFPYSRIPHDMGYQPLLILLVATGKDICFEEFPMRWGKVESSNVNLLSYGVKHLWRLFRFATGRIPLTDSSPDDFQFDQIYPVG